MFSYRVCVCTSVQTKEPFINSSQHLFPLKWNPHHPNNSSVFRNSLIWVLRPITQSHEAPMFLYNVQTFSEFTWPAVSSRHWISSFWQEQAWSHLSHLHLTSARDCGTQLQCFIIHQGTSIPYNPVSLFAELNQWSKQAKLSSGKHCFQIIPKRIMFMNKMLFYLRKKKSSIQHLFKKSNIKHSKSFDLSQ